MGKHLTLGNTHHCWQCANYASDICSRGTDITSEMCSGAHISRGNIYHCNTGYQRKIIEWFWHIPTAKRWACALSERFFKEKPSFFDKPAPKSNSPCLATSTRQKSRSFSSWVHYFKKNRSDRARRVVHWSPCRVFHASLCTSQSKKFCGDFHFLVTTYLLCMEMTSSCLRL